MFEALEVEVLRLIRTSIGPLQLGDVPKGTIRELQRTERMALDSAIRASSDDS